MISTDYYRTEVSKDIREEFDQEFSQEKKTGGVFQFDWENEEEVLDAVKESERLRNKNFQEEVVLFSVPYNLIYSESCVKSINPTATPSSTSSRLSPNSIVYTSSINSSGLSSCCLMSIIFFTL